MIRFLDQWFFLCLVWFLTNPMTTWCQLVDKISVRLISFPFVCRPIRLRPMEVTVLISHFKRIWWWILINFHLSASNFQMKLVVVVVHISNWWNWLWIDLDTASGFKTENLPEEAKGWPFVYVVNTAAVGNMVGSRPGWSVDADFLKRCNPERFWCGAEITSGRWRES
jgi:hypothetical protein